jgi:SAM-dependent methyltransferase
MRLGTIGETLLERIALRVGLVPVPLIETFGGMLVSRTIMAATKLGVFAALEPAPLTAEEVAAHCGTDPRATGKLLFALAGHGYLRFDRGRYRLAPVARKWLAGKPDESLVDSVLFRYLEWDWIGGLEDFVRSGRPLEVHDGISGEGWALYQRGMRSLATFGAREVARRVPVPKDARDLLDVGGAHGYFSVQLCRRHEGLRATVLELPEAIASAAPLLAAEGMGDRVVHLAGDARVGDLGVEAYDVVFAGNLVHHFDDETNRDLTRRVARALRPGGVYVIFDGFGGRTPKQAGQAGAGLELYFALTSAAGTWPAETMAEWQRAAGLVPHKPIRLRALRLGQGLQVATKPPPMRV